MRLSYRIGSNYPVITLVKIVKLSRPDVGQYSGGDYEERMDGNGIQLVLDKTEDFIFLDDIRL